MLVTLEIPDTVGAEMRLPASEAQAEVRKEIALALYARGLMSLGKATEFAGMTRPDFEAVLAKRRVERPYDEVELKRDLAWAKDAK